MGPDAYIRVYGEWRASARHTWRVLYAPLEVSGTGSLPASTFFVDTTFAPGVPTLGTYKFNNYRANWRYTLNDSPGWRIQLGAGVLVRDARIELRQGDLQAADPDLGFVPVVVFSAERQISPRLNFIFDFEGLGSTQGRALDGSLKLTYDVTPALAHRRGIPRPGRRRRRRVGVHVRVHSLRSRVGRLPILTGLASPAPRFPETAVPFCATTQPIVPARKSLGGMRIAPAGWVVAS